MIGRLSMARLPAPPLGVLANPAGFSGVRLTAELAAQGMKRFAERSAQGAAAGSGLGLTILALSGGGAGGAFGAGLLVGLSQSGLRPQFDIVTGVSTGALIAPLAFLGRDWDPRLADAYTAGHAADLLGVRSIYRGDGLDLLVDRFVDDKLLQAVAAESAKGRRLFVATTNLDAQQTVVWDLGAIAAKGGEAALRLFHDILVASASLPGLFPPKLIDVESETGRFQEMHVDGGASTPLFILPEGLLQAPGVNALLRGSTVYVVVNTGLEPLARTTATNRIAVMVRSFETMLHFSYRHAVEAAAALCQSADLKLWIASAPTDPDDTGVLRFETEAMRQVFDAAADLARSGRAWSGAALTAAASASASASACTNIPRLSAPASFASLDPDQGARNRLVAHCGMPQLLPDEISPPDQEPELPALPAEEPSPGPEPAYPEGEPGPETFPEQPEDLPSEV